MAHLSVVLDGDLVDIDKLGQVIQALGDTAAPQKGSNIISHKEVKISECADGRVRWALQRHEDRHTPKDPHFLIKRMKIA
jgi:hypothetical protein